MENKTGKTNPLAYFIVAFAITGIMLYFISGFSGSYLVSGLEFISIYPIILLGVWAPGVHSALKAMGLPTWANTIHSELGIVLIIVPLVLIAPTNTMAVITLLFGIGALGHFISHSLERKMLILNITRATVASGAMSLLTLTVRPITLSIFA